MNIKSSLPSFFRSSQRVSPFAALQSEIDRAFDSFRDVFPGETAGLAPAGVMVPKMDLSETDGTIEVKMDLPGIKEEEIDVTLSGDMLTIKGEHAEEKEEKKKDYHVLERYQGSFRRQIPLGFTADADTVKASFKDGVLTVTIEKPKTLTEQSRKIAIEKA